jgi:hypothetical protein
MSLMIIKTVGYIATLLGIGLIVVWQGSSVTGERAASQAGYEEPAYPEYGPIPDQVLQGLVRQQVEVADNTARTANAAAAVSLEDGVDVARAELDLGDVPTDLTTATLATVTTHDYGVELEPDPTKPSRIDPTIEDQLVWVITFSDVSERPISGAPVSPITDAEEDTIVTWVVLVDSDDPEFLLGLAF